MRSSEEFAKELTKQLSRLWRSCRDFDKGEVDEAIRIATIIRVLVHDTTHSPCLLRHLNALDVCLGCLCEGAGERAVFYSAMSSFTFARPSDDVHTVQHVAMTEASLVKLTLPRLAWWSKQTIFVQGSLRLTRRDIVLNAADKDGGAHVDATLNPHYQALMNKDGRTFWSISDGQTSAPVTDVHLSFLRAMGTELLNSPDLLDLARV